MKTNEYGDEIIDTGSGSGPSNNSGGSGSGGILSSFFPGNTQALKNVYKNSVPVPNVTKNPVGAVQAAGANTGKLGMDLIKSIPEDAMWTGGGILSKLLGKGAITAGKGTAMIAKYPTKGGLAAATDAAAAEGKYLPWQDMKNTITNNVFNGKSGTGGLLDTTANQTALKNIFAALEKNGIDNEGMSTLNALKGRRQIAASLPQNFISQLFNGGKPANQVGGVVRNSLSDFVHQGAPATVPLDKLYGAYAHAGDIPTILKHAGAAYLTDRVGKAVGGPAAEGAADLFSLLKYVH